MAHKAKRGLSTQAAYTELVPDEEPRQNHSTTGLRLIKVGGKTIGAVAPDCVFRKHLNFSLHLFRRLHAIATDVEALDDAESFGALWVEVTDDETGRIVHTTIAHYRANGIPVNFGSRQLALPLSQWTQGPFKGPQPEQLSFLAGLP